MWNKSNTKEQKRKIESIKDHLWEEILTDTGETIDLYGLLWVQEDEKWAKKNF